MRPVHEVADILNRYESQWKGLLKLSSHQLRMLGAIQQCRTAALGGHLDACTSCASTRISYNSCRNRHCPKCQTVNRERWISAREQELLPVSYYHLVFTLPEEINSLCLQFPKAVYGLLFGSAWDTIRDFAQNPKHLGATTAMTAILHTWGQNLSLHPHIHCLVPSGGMSKAGHWKGAPRTGKMLFPVKAISKVFRGKFIDGLSKLGYLNETLKTQLYSKKWVVYAKRPFFGPTQIIEYLGRYTHKIAVSNHRLVDIANNKVIFKWKDYRDASMQKLMTLSPEEFVRRFALHLLPHGFTRIRHYGMIASRNKTTLLVEAGRQLGVRITKTEKKDWKTIASERLNFEPQACPHCKTGKLVTIQEIRPQRGPPKTWPSLSSE